MVSNGGILLHLPKQALSTTHDIRLGFALAQRSVLLTQLCVSLAQALAEVLAVFLVLLTWFLDREIETLHRELPTIVTGKQVQEV